MTALATAPTQTTDRGPGPVGNPDDPALFAEVSHFYARQMRAMDEGDARAWAESFTEDGVFEANAHPEPFAGRASIESSSRAAAEQLRRDRLRRRHWLGMLQLDSGPDGSVLARTYAQILQIEIGGTAELRLSTTCTDELVRVDGRLQVRHRSVRRDDLD